MFKEYGIRLRSPLEAWKIRKKKLAREINAKQVKKMYFEEKLSLEEIGKRLGLDRKALARRMRARGIRIKTVSEGNAGKRKSDAHRKNISVGRKRMLRNSPQLIEKIRRNRLKQILPTRDTSIELIVEKELFKRGVNHEKQHAILGVCQADKAFPREKIAVFCDGDYWHRRKETIKRDERINEVLRRNGWLVLRFWEAEIREAPEKVADEIITALNWRKLNGCTSSQVEKECGVSLKREASPGQAT
ncbi:MAG: DUF559 domain-containing protein [Candidatus Micrarchaeota archaeon]